MVEPVEHFLEAAKRNLAQGYSDGGHGMSDWQEESSRHRAVNFFLTPLQVRGLAEMLLMFTKDLLVRQAS